MILSIQKILGLLLASSSLLWASEKFQNINLDLPGYQQMNQVSMLLKETSQIINNLQEIREKVRGMTAHTKKEEKNLKRIKSQACKESGRLENLAQQIHGIVINIDEIDKTQWEDSHWYMYDELRNILKLQTGLINSLYEK